MSKNIITVAGSGQYLSYDSSSGVARVKTSERLVYRCPQDCIMRIDFLVDTPYKSTIYISESQFNKIKDLGAIPSIKMKNEYFTYGRLIADAVKGASINRGPIFNILATSKYLREFSADDVNVFFKEGTNNAKIQIHCTDELVDINEIFYISNISKEKDIRDILGVNFEFNVTDVLRELKIFSIEENTKYFTSAYFDGEQFRYNRLYKLMEE